MPRAAVDAEFAHQINILALVGAAGALSDGQLLQRFLARRDESSQAAFTTLVDRHGLMVLRVCRQILGDSHDAQDAYQATFMVLARKAGSVRNADLVASWLHGVAHKVSMRAKADAIRRKAHEERGAEIRMAGRDSEGIGHEPWLELHEEIARLPERYREPIVLCYLEGMPTDAVAERLGCPKGTVLSRLSRARERLRIRLARRGLAPASAFSVGGLLSLAHPAALPTALVREAVRAAIPSSGLKAASASSASTMAVALAKGVLRDMSISPLKSIGIAGLACVLTLAGAVMVAAKPIVTRGDDDSSRPTQRVQTEDEASRLAQKLQGEWESVELEIQGTKGTEEEAKSLRISIKGDEVTVRFSTNGPDRPGRKSTLKRLDPTKSPMEMDLLALERREKGMTQHCIFSLDKGRLQLCAPLFSDKRPTEFKTKAGDGFMLTTLKRVESKPANDPPKPPSAASPTPAPSAPGPRPPLDTGSRAEEVPAARYRLSPGEEITYRSETRDGDSSYKVDWKVWALDRDADGSWRLVIRCDLSTTRKLFGGKQETSPGDTILWRCRLFEDGRLVGASARGTVRDPFRFFPRLPDGPDDLANGWESPGSEAEQVRIRYRLTSKPELGSSTLAITATHASPKDKVYGSDQVTRATFDASRGLVTRSESEDTSGYPNKSASRGLIELVSVEQNGKAWAEKFGLDSDAYFAAVESYESAHRRADRDAGRCKAILADAKAELQVARGAIEAPSFREALDERLAQHDRSVGQVAEQAARRAILVGKPAADWEAKDINGKGHRMADYRGRVVVMDFWYRGCGWCMTAMPHVNRISEAFRDQPVSVLGMSVDEDERDARIVIEAMKLRYPTIRAAELVERFGIQAYPTLIVIDQRGKIREVQAGYSPRLFDDLSGSIRELLAERPSE
jgi:RNA polymerase sigma factor (sigma-70 family)